MKCGGENRVCTSGVCGMDDLCRQEPIGNESPCRNDAQCASTECARSDADATASLVCCSSGDSIGVPYPNYVCTGLAAGMKCGGENRVCRSGSCDSNELCTKQFVGSWCNGNNDDCVNGACGQVEAVQGAEFICCPSGKTLVGGSSSLSVCTNIGEENQACFDDSICKSSVCVMGVCQGRKWGNEPCEKDTHCHSGRCENQDSDGLGSCQPFASPAAKNDYINDSADCPLDKLAPPDANDISSVSIGFGTWLDAFSQVPNKGVIVGQEVLGGVDKCLGSFVAQRQGSQVCFSYQREDDNGGGNSSFACVKKCIDVCARNAICNSDRFEKYTTDSLFSGKTCYVAVKSEDAEADGNNEEYELFEADVIEDIFFGDPDVAEDIFYDPDAIEDILLDTMAALSHAQGSSSGIIASVRISLFAAASHVLLFWFW